MKGNFRSSAKISYGTLTAKLDSGEGISLKKEHALLGACLLKVEKVLALSILSILVDMQE